MTDDAGRGRLGGTGAAGNAGPIDPTADPRTDPGLRPDPAGGTVVVPPSVPPAGDRTGGPTPAARHSRTGVLWTGLILSALVLLFLLVFILQNDQPVLISFFALEGVLPSGVALLLAAIAGILLGAIPGTLRILQLRRAARRGPR
jgi:uncharacterized integral membrane protein